MRGVNPSWKAGVVLVCSNERAPDADKASCGHDRATDLRGWLKDRIKAEGLKGQVLSSRTTCLGICSKLGVTVDIVPAPGRGTRRMLIVDPVADREALWAQIKACLITGEPSEIEMIADSEL